MKKSAFLILLLLLFLLSACNANLPDTSMNHTGTQPSGSYDTQASTPPTQSDPVPSDTVPEPPTEPTADPTMQAELDAFTALFRDTDAIYQYALSHRFDSPDRVRLKLLFMNGFADEPRTPTEEEWAALEGTPGFDEKYNLFRLPVAKMNKVLNQSFDISLDKMSEGSFIGLTYLESTDCYYFMGMPSYGVAEYTAINIQPQGSDTVMVTYTLYDQYHYVYLKQAEDCWQILANDPTRATLEPVDWKMSATHITAAGEVKETTDLRISGNLCLYADGAIDLDADIFTPATFRYGFARLSPDLRRLMPTLQGVFTFTSYGTDRKYNEGIDYEAALDPSNECYNYMLEARPYISHFLPGGFH